MARKTGKYSIFRKSKYSTMHDPSQKDNQEYVKKTNEWIYREEHRWHGKPWRLFCKDCSHSQKGHMMKCTSCGSQNLVALNPSVRVPRKGASKKKWENFINRKKK